MACCKSKLIKYVHFESTVGDSILWIKVDGYITLNKKDLFIISALVGAMVIPDHVTLNTSRGSPMSAKD